MFKDLKDQNVELMLVFVKKKIIYKRCFITFFKKLFFTGGFKIKILQ